MSTHQVSFAAVKSAVSLEAVLHRYQLLSGLAQKGANLTGSCPFCKGKSDRQFRVSLEKNAWYCFGCKQGGNILDFVAKTERVSLRAAALMLDQLFELGLAAPETSRKPDPPQAPASIDEPRPLGPNPPLSFALKTLDHNHESLAALGLSEATVQYFGLGFCAKGLLKGRIAIPIHNRVGDLVAYAGIAPDLEGGERYLLPPKFHSSVEVFNLHRTLVAPEEDGPVHLASEIFDALRLVDAGVARVLSVFDGALSEPQHEALAALSSADSRLILVGDGFEPQSVTRLCRSFAVRSLGLEEALDPEAALPAE